MSHNDDELIQAARNAIKTRFRPDWHVVGAAIRLRTGEVVTGVHLDANVGRVAVCAEAIALGRAVTEHGSSDIESVVAAYHSSNGQISVVAPCGNVQGDDFGLFANRTRADARWQRKLPSDGGGSATSR